MSHYLVDKQIRSLLWNSAGSVNIFRFFFFELRNFKNFKIIRNCQYHSYGLFNIILVISRYLFAESLLQHLNPEICCFMVSCFVSVSLVISIEHPRTRVSFFATIVLQVTSCANAIVGIVGERLNNIGLSH